MNRFWLCLWQILFRLFLAKLCSVHKLKSQQVRGFFPIRHQAGDLFQILHQAGAIFPNRTPVISRSVRDNYL